MKNFIAILLSVSLLWLPLEARRRWIPKISSGSLTYAQTVLATSGLIGYWKLSDASTDIALDSSSGGTHSADYNPNSAGLWTGGTQGLSGIPGGAGATSVSFDGASGYITQTTINSVQNSATTASIEAWIWVPSTTVFVQVGYAFGGTGNRFGFNVDTDGNIYWIVENGSASFPSCAYSHATNAWMHVAMSYDGSQTGLARIKCYINGSVQSLTTGGATPVSALSATLGDFYMGNTTTTSSSKLCQVALYTTTVSAADWANHYAVGH